MCRVGDLDDDGFMASPMRTISIDTAEMYADGEADAGRPGRHEIHLDRDALAALDAEFPPPLHAQPLEVL